MDSPTDDGFIALLGPGRGSDPAQDPHPHVNLLASAATGRWQAVLSALWAHRAAVETDPDLSACRGLLLEHLVGLTPGLAEGAWMTLHALGIQRKLTGWQLWVTDMDGQQTLHLGERCAPPFGDNEPRPIELRCTGQRAVATLADRGSWNRFGSARCPACAGRRNTQPGLEMDLREDPHRRWVDSAANEMLLGDVRMQLDTFLRHTLAATEQLRDEHLAAHAAESVQRYTTRTEPGYDIQTLRCYARAVIRGRLATAAGLQLTVNQEAVFSHAMGRTEAVRLRMDLGVGRLDELLTADGQGPTSAMQWAALILRGLEEQVIDRQQAIAFYARELGERAAGGNPVRAGS